MSLDHCLMIRMYVEMLVEDFRVDNTLTKRNQDWKACIGAFDDGSSTLQFDISIAKKAQYWIYAGIYGYTIKRNIQKLTSNKTAIHQCPNSYHVGWGIEISLTIV